MPRYRNNVTGAVRKSSTYPGAGWTLIREPKPKAEPKPKRATPA